VGDGGIGDGTGRFGSVAERAQCAARATAVADMEVMRRALLHFLEPDDYLSGQAIPEAI
jgi:hypothetical protein